MKSKMVRQFVLKSSNTNLIKIDFVSSRAVSYVQTDWWMERSAGLLKSLEPSTALHATSVIA
jgi:hypothetical protein